jgi:hypothetical protein
MDTTTTSALDLVVPSPQAGVEETTFTNVSEFLAALRPRSEFWRDDPTGWVYRGHADATWPLKPMSVRSPEEFARHSVDGPSSGWSERADRQTELLERFAELLHQSGLTIPTEAPQIVPRNSYGSSAFPMSSAFPLLALARHHGMPTPLLDWSRRGVVAAYFAAVATVENLEVGSDDDFLAVWGLHRTLVMDRVDRLIFYEAPSGTNPNLHAQAGLFTLDMESDEDVDLVTYLGGKPSLFGSVVFRRLLLPRKQAPQLLRYLAEEGVSGASLFPGVDGVVRAMRERALWSQ